MKCIILFCFSLFTLTFSVKAQNEYNIWYFGNHVGLNFNTNPPTVLFDSKTYTFESSTSICDKNGNLLFYTNGDTVYNKNHEILKNGTITNYKGRFSSMQGSMALPVPNSDSLYYLILCSSVEYTYRNPLDSLRYWIIDMSLDNGLGEVIKKEIAILPGTLESFSVAMHSNNKDYWVGTCDHILGNYNLIKTINGKFDSVHLTHKIPDFITAYVWANKFSPNSKIVATNSFLVRDNNAPDSTHAYLNLYKFDNTKGKLFDRVIIDIGYSMGMLKIEFSPNSRFLYIYIPPNTKIRYGIYQLDLSKWNSDSINNSAKFLDLNLIYGCKGIQLGPDKKVYIFPDGGDSYYMMTVIPHPNLEYPKCIENYSQISLSPRFNSYGGPYYPNFWFHEPFVNLGEDTILCNGDTMNLAANIQNIDSAKWNNGDTKSNTKIYNPGKYWITVYDGHGKNSDTIIIKGVSKPTLALTDEISLCEIPTTFSYPGSGQLLWNTGITNSTIQIEDTGTYWVQISNNYCSIRDSIHVKMCDEMTYFIPNTFTPDYNGLNDKFHITGTNFNNISLEIYNRWGQRLYKESSLNPNWDGTYLDKECEQGIYFYKILISGVKNNISTNNAIYGNVLLLR